MQTHWSSPTTQSNLTALTTGLRRFQGYKSLAATISEQESLPRRGEAPAIQVSSSPLTTRRQSADIHGLDHGGLVIPGTPPLHSPPPPQQNCSVGANVRRKVAGIYKTIKSRIRADEVDQEPDSAPLPRLPRLPRSQVPLPSDRFLANAALQARNDALERQLAELQEESERNRRRVVETEEELQDYKLQLRRQCAETDALEKQIQSRNPLINLDSASADPYYLLQMAPTASSAEVGIRSPHRQNSNSENDGDQCIEVMLPGHQGRFLISFSDHQESVPYQLPEIAPQTLFGFGDLLTRIGVNEPRNTVNESGYGVAELEGEPSFLAATEMVGRHEPVKLFSWPIDPSREVLRPDEEILLLVS
jgi:hypothetical protein